MYTHVREWHPVPSPWPLKYGRVSLHLVYSSDRDEDCSTFVEKKIPDITKEMRCVKISFAENTE